MAKIRFGAVVAAASGSIEGTVFSRNAYGAYARNRSIPVNPDTTYQQAIRAHLAAASTAWGALTANQKAAWETWAQTNPVTDRMGDQQVLAPNAAYIRINHRLLQAGDSTLSVPPVGAQPNALSTMSLNGDIGAGAFDVTFTPAIGADERMFLHCAVLDSAGITYVKNLTKLVVISAKAVASPYDFQTVCEARFGTLAVGQTLVALAQVFDTLTGQISTHMRASVVLTST